MIIGGTHDWTRSLQCANKIFHVPTRKIAVLDGKILPKISLAPLARMQIYVPIFESWIILYFFISRLVYTIYFCNCHKLITCIIQIKIHRISVIYRICRNCFFSNNACTGLKKIRVEKLLEIFYWHGQLNEIYTFLIYEDVYIV